MKNNQYITQLKTKRDLNNFFQHKNGEVVYVESERKYYVWDGSQWNNVTINNDGVSLSLYELNKNIMVQMPTISNSNKLEAIKLIDEYKKDTNQKYYMLICKEYNYYTLFEIDNDNLFEDTLSLTAFDCLKNVGEVISVDKNEIGAIEIWVKINKEAYAFYLFGYDNGVVKVGR